MAEKTTLSDDLLALLTTEVSGEISSSRQLCPEGINIPASIEGYIPASGTLTSADGESERAWYSITFQYLIEDKEIQSLLGRDKVIVQGKAIYLSKSASGALDLLANDNLGILIRLFNISEVGKTVREVLDSFLGHTCVVQVAHITRMKKDEVVLDVLGNPIIDARVVGIAKM